MKLNYHQLESAQNFAAIRYPSIRELSVGAVRVLLEAVERERGLPGAPDSIESGGIAAGPVLTWQERVLTPTSDDVYWGTPVSKRAMNAMEAEIADLRAALAAQPAPVSGAMSDDQKKVGKWIIMIEMMLCAALGRQWSENEKIESMILELSGRAAARNEDEPEQPAPQAPDAPVAQLSGNPGGLAQQAPDSARDAGYCTHGKRCVCGGDIPRVRAGCGNWISGGKAQ